MIQNNNKMTTTQAIKKEIKKQVKINGSHTGTVRKALQVQFPSTDTTTEDWTNFIQHEFAAKYANVESTTKARF